MDAALENLQSVAVASLDPIWSRFAKEGRESAVFAPMSKYPKSSAWLAESMSMTNDYVVRKLGAMLAGWIQYPQRAELLLGMLNRERGVFRGDPLSANSVGEDIMFAATRWTESENPQIKAAGINILAIMIKDALSGTPWNVVHWAVANLSRVTEGRHEILPELGNATDSQMERQPFLLKAANAIRQSDRQQLDRYFTPPSELYLLPSDDSQYQMASSLWTAAELAEAVIV